MYNWIDDKTGDRHSLIDMKETEWLCNKSYFDVSKEQIHLVVL
jgi:hypothetical protein